MKKEVKIQENVKIESKKPEVKDKNKQPLVTTVLLILLIIALGAIMYLAYMVLDSKEPTNISENITSEEAATEVIEVVTEEEDEDEIVIEEVIRYPSHKLDLTNSGFIQIPDGWRVTKFASNSSQLTEIQMNDYLNPMNHGYWPMYEGVELVLTNGESVIEFGRRTQLIAGGVGFVVNQLDSTYEIVLEPSIDDTASNPDRSKFGIARRLVLGRYEYLHIVKDSGAMDGVAEGYIDGNVGPTNYYFTFTGSNSDIDVVELFFKNSCMIDSSKLCGSL